jgi:hypothetical protein
MDTTTAPVVGATVSPLPAETLSTAPPPPPEPKAAYNGAVEFANVVVGKIPAFNVVGFSLPSMGDVKYVGGVPTTGGGGFVKGILYY